jgi:hypothetical protein
LSVFLSPRKYVRDGRDADSTGLHPVQREDSSSQVVGFAGGPQKHNRRFNGHHSLPLEHDVRSSHLNRKVQRPLFCTQSRIFQSVCLRGDDMWWHACANGCGLKPGYIRATTDTRARSYRAPSARFNLDHVASGKKDVTNTRTSIAPVKTVITGTWKAENLDDVRAARSCTDRPPFGAPSFPLVPAFSSPRQSMVAPTRHKAS